MTRRVLAFILPVAAISIACKGGTAAKLEGRWHGIKATGVPSEQTSAANLFASAMILEFHGDQVSVRTGSEKQSAKFRVVRDDKTTVTIATDQDGPDDVQTFTFADDATISWAVMPGKSILFQKE